MSANVMTREQKLYSMRIVDLVEVAEKLGVKIDKKGKKSVAVQKILDAEQNVAGDGTSLVDVRKEIAQQAKEKAEKYTKSKTDKVQKVAKSVLKKASKTVEKKANKSNDNFDELLSDICELLKETSFVISEAKTSGRYKYIVNKDVKGSTVLLYIGKKRISMMLRNNHSLDSIKPSRVRNTGYSKVYDIDYSKKEKLVEYLNKINYNNTKKSKKGEK